MPKNIYTHCQRDGCGKPKIVPNTNYLPTEAYAQDPYCSRPCAEIAQGTKTEQELADEANGWKSGTRTTSGASTRR